LRAEKQKEILCWGKNVVMTLMQNFPERCSKVIISKRIKASTQVELISLAKGKGVRYDIVASEVIDSECEENHQGVLAYAQPLCLTSLEDLISKNIEQNSPSLLLLLDHLKDPHNLGAILRTAETAGADAVIIPKDRSVSVNGTVIKVSSGAALRLPVVSVVNLNRSIELLKSKGYWIVGLDHKAENTVWDTPFPERTVLTLGSEGEGLSRLVKKNCDDLRKIPMAGTTGSLNVSVAGAIGIYEWFRNIRSL